MRLLILLLALWAGGAAAQIPRTQSGQYEYSGEVSGIKASLLKERASRFFNQPFLVHWDSAVKTLDGNRYRGKGYVTVQTRRHSVGLPTTVKVYLLFELDLSGDSYKYKMSHFRVAQTKGPNFPLETKPDSIKRLVYDQLKHKTHERVTAVIGWLKKYMRGEEG
jgi:hypothetical protein